MNDLKEIARTSLIIGRISGKSIVTQRYLENALELIEEDFTEAKRYIEDALHEVKEIHKLTKKI